MDKLSIILIVLILIHFRKVNPLVMFVVRSSEVKVVSKNIRTRNIPVRITKNHLKIILEQ